MSSLIIPVITVKVLQEICLRTSKEILEKRVPLLQETLKLAFAHSNLRAASLLSQYCYESAWLTAWVEEPSDVSGPDFEKYEPGTHVGKILGNTKKGDGKLFLGRGLVQLTGRYNYMAAGKALGIDLIAHPEWAAEEEIAAKIAAWYWTSRNLNALADKGDFVGITKKINGGTNGLEFRQKAFNRALKALAA